MRNEIYMLGGIEGLQATSTRVVTTALHRQLEAMGWRCRLLVLRPRFVPRMFALRWAAEVIYRQFIYPAWCRRRVPGGGLAYVTDHANASVVLHLKKGVRTVVHVHDLASIRPPWDFPFPLRARNVLIWALGLPTKRRGIRRADRLIAISEFTAGELARYLGIDRDRITVVPNGVDHEVYQPMDPLEGRRVMKIPVEDFVVMTVGPPSYRKNTSVLAKALGQAKNELVPLRWVHVGALDAKTRRILRAAGLQNSLLVLRGLSDAEMRSLYSMATVLVHPSLYEGFGLPPVEALACGRPVIASDIPASREVLGRAVDFFPANSPGELARRLVALKRQVEAASGAAADRRRSSVAGYTWERAAKDVDMVLRSAHPEFSERVHSN